MSRPLCHFFNTPAGCYRGNQCKFAHSPASTNNQTSESARPLSPSTRDSSRSRSPQNASRPGGAGKPPQPGVCKYYWEKGRCNREFGCRYKHVQQTDNANPPRAPTPTNVAQPTVLQRVAPFLTEQGLSKMSGSGTDGFFSQDSVPLSPSEAHNTLKKYLSDFFRFKITFEIYAFLRPLNSASASNASWVRHAIVCLSRRMLLKLLFSRLKKKAR
ncbi:hypothetical protein J3R82DRAFT_3675 [Butyriboletus roseoflavus]|nr:hypothetical protein J3R82DRAFT_3675 [Butyriboletus roseoflavus]